MKESDPSNPMTHITSDFLLPAISLLIVSAWALTGPASANPANQPTQPADPPTPNPYSNAPKVAVEAWRQWKFGALIQWNMSSLEEGEIGWSRGGTRWGFSDWGTGGVPVDVYDNLYKRFKAQRFDAHNLCQILKNAGMRYAFFCNKHHDGFCMWDTKLSDYKITSPECPCGRDLTKEWAEACTATGLRYGVYFSQPDWYHPDYLRSEEAHKRFIATMHGWVTELLSNYGTVDAIFFDGLGGLATNWDSAALFSMIRKLQPAIMINNRCGAHDVEGFPVHRWMQRSEDRLANLPMTLGFAGDYDTPEETVNRMQTDRPWETCMPLQNGQWSYSSQASMKSLTEVLQTLVSVAGRDGNLMVSPALKPDGSMDPRAEELLQGCGEWLKRYGTTVYETRGGPYYPTPLGVSTYRDNTIFVHLLRWPEDKLTLPPIQHKLLSSRVPTGGTADVRQSADGSIEITVPAEHRNQIDTIVELRLDGPAADAKPGRLALGSLATGKPVKASNVYAGNPWFSPQNAVDDDAHTRWATDFGTKQAWLEVDLGAEKTFNGVLIKEDLGFIRRFEVQVRQGDAWTPVLQGERIGSDCRRTFPPVKARFVRLAILDAITAPQYPDNGITSHTMAQPGPCIWEFQVLSNEPEQERE
jgi:alpha-L-fucosidase